MKSREQAACEWGAIRAHAEEMRNPTPRGRKRWHEYVRRCVSELKKEAAILDRYPRSTIELTMVLNSESSRVYGLGMSEKTIKDLLKWAVETPPSPPKIENYTLEIKEDFDSYYLYRPHTEEWLYIDPGIRGYATCWTREKSHMCRLSKDGETGLGPRIVKAAELQKQLKFDYDVSGWRNDMRRFEEAKARRDFGKQTRVLGAV